jgi:hypothetical protein
MLDAELAVAFQLGIVVEGGCEGQLQKQNQLPHSSRKRGG